MPRIAVNIVTYNSVATIRTCLCSLAAQTYTDFQIKIIDNASADNSAQLVAEMGYPVEVNSTNRGYAAAHNQAILQTQSEYVLTLNPDIWLDPCFLQSMVNMLDTNPTIGSASGCLLRVDQLGHTPDSIDSTGLFMRRNRRQGLQLEGASPAQSPQTPQLIFGPDGAAAFYRRAMLDDIQIMGEVFDEDFFMHKEDVDIAWRAQLRGWQSLYIPQAIAHHIRTFRPGQRQNVSADLRFYGVRNRYLMMIKNEIPRHFFRDLWAIGLYDIGIFGYIVLRERESLAALVAVLKLFKRMMTKRHLIQSHRKISPQALAQWFR